ncbi:hypothetical protein GA0070616_2410 [Micromonospora nigra]|uniref:Uncharacterized protein n=1 Tax=Micromonospora nigra TaxID=145857 RepID=A0A1C6RXS5_9ACTN|nr:hypothetical protein [Micromonospora nigra]SCL21874.1 hypothetical protein GA0070616_2410 [Micromonospora nigra]
MAGTIVSADVIPGKGWNVVLTPETSLDKVADEAGALVKATGFTQHTQARSKPDNRGYRNDKYEIFINRQDSDGTVSYTVFTR